MRAKARVMVIRLLWFFYINQIVGGYDEVRSRPKIELGFCKSMLGQMCN